MPRIGLAMSLELDTGRFFIGRDYSSALLAFGAVPLHIPLISDKKYLRECLKNLDGILLPGSGCDVDPSRFKEEPISALGRVIPEKDEHDFFVLETAEDLKIPVLAICYGMQALNVQRGGTLFQDIETQIPDAFKHQQGKPLNRNSHSVVIENEGVLASIIEKKRLKNEFRVNSHHHQSVKEAGKNLRVTARAKDGVVECIEDTRENRLVLGVQWHPELSWKDDEFSREIFKVFVEECKKYAGDKQRTNIK